MIKVNLLKNRGGSGGGSGTKTEFGEMSFDENFEASSESSVDPKEFIFKLIIILMWVVGLYAYEQYNLGLLDDERKTVTQTVNQLNTRVQALQPEVEKSKALIISLIKDVRKLRAENNIMPNKTIKLKIYAKNKNAEIK